MCLGGGLVTRTASYSDTRNISARWLAPFTSWNGVASGSARNQDLGRRAETDVGRAGALPAASRCGGSAVADQIRGRNSR
jgi:hypothetical protein